APGAFGEAWKRNAMIEMSLLTNGCAGVHQLLHQGLVEGDDLVERIANLAAHSEFVNGHSHTEVSISYLGKNGKKFALVQHIIIPLRSTRGLARRLSISLRGSSGFG